MGSSSSVDPDFEFRDLPALPGSGVFIGAGGAVRAWYAKLVGMPLKTSASTPTTSSMPVIASSLPSVRQVVARASGVKVEMQMAQRRDAERRKGRQAQYVRRSRRSPRSRRVAGVARYCAGDVAGERGDRAAGLRGRVAKAEAGFRDPQGRPFARTTRCSRCSPCQGGSYRGAQGFRDRLASWGEMFGEAWECTVEQARAIDGERVLVTGWIKVQGLGGGVPVEQRIWLAMTVLVFVLHEPGFAQWPRQTQGN